MGSFVIVYVNFVTTTELKTKERSWLRHLISEVQKKDNQFSKPIELHCPKGRIHKIFGAPVFLAPTICMENPVIPVRILRERFFFGKKK